MKKTGRKATINDCRGCRNDFYNGKNGLNVKKCWSLADAKMVNKVQIHVDQVPPYRNVIVQPRPDCYHVARYVFVAPERISKDGYLR